MTGEGILLEAIGQSLLVLGVGLVAGTVVGIVLGLAVGRSRVVEALLDLPTIALYATPMVALVPVLVLWFGFGMTAKIVIVFLFAVFPVLINTTRGVKEADPQLEEVARSFCSSERRKWFDLTLPSALPYIVTGVRLAIGRGLIGVVVAEFYTSISGLGLRDRLQRQPFRTSRMFVPIVVLMILGVVLTKALEMRRAAADAHGLRTSGKGGASDDDENAAATTRVAAGAAALVAAGCSEGPIGLARAGRPQAGSSDRAEGRGKVVRVALPTAQTSFANADIAVAAGEGLLQEAGHRGRRCRTSAPG